MSFEKLTSSLNPAQKEGVENIIGPLLVLAGAGSGKTRVLTHRIANIIAQGEAAPNEILAMTFTNKAAREMHDRAVRVLYDIGIPISERMWISTFHSTCARILRDHLGLMGYQPNWVIYDSSDQEKMVKKIIAEMGLSDKAYPPKTLMGRFNNAKSLGLDPGNIDSASQFLMDKKSIEAYVNYEKAMKSANSLDFSDLLLKTHQLFLNHPNILADYQNLFRFILVDEYQDTNRIQYLLLKQLASVHHNLCAVGDEDQSIYSWRGADIGNIFSFEKDFPECRTVKLEQNYRSSKTIVTAASKVISNNTQRKDKVLFTENDDGDKIKIIEGESEYDEARIIAREIQSLLDIGEYTLSEMSIFYRTNAQSRVIEEQLRACNISYRIVGGVKFYDRKEVKDVLCYFRYLINPADTIAFKRILNTPRRGIGKTTIDKIESIGASDENWHEALKKIIRQELLPKGSLKKLGEFYRLTEILQEEAKTLITSELYQSILEKTGYVNLLKNEDTSEADARIENLGEFNNAIVQFEQERGDEATLKNFLEEMALVSDVDSMEDNQPVVTLMTLHISKGLEYPVVFLAGLEEGLFPSIRSNEQADDSMEEERRLAYVGMTRAEKKLFLTYARKRRLWGQEKYNPPSRFINEIPAELVDAFVTSPRQRPQANPQWSDSSSQGTFSKRPQTITRKKAHRSFDRDFDSSSMPNYEDFGDESFDSESGLRKGMKVKHPTYGVGSVVGIEGDGESQKVSVMFPNKHVKKFMTKFARLEQV